jgi:MFS superfamily sulfate permease-like transporter
MSMGRIVAVSVGCLILAIIAALVTRNIIIAIAFPILLVAFLLMWRNLKQNTPVQETKQVQKQQEQQSNKTENSQTPQQQEQNTQAPVSTNYPPKQNPPTYN